MVSGRTSFALLRSNEAVRGNWLCRSVGASEEQKISLSDRRAALFDYVLLLPARNAVVVDRAWGLHFNYSPHNVFGHSTFLRT